MTPLTYTYLLEFSVYKSQFSGSLNLRNESGAAGRRSKTRERSRARHPRTTLRIVISEPEIHIAHRSVSRLLTGGQGDKYAIYVCDIVCLRVAQPGADCISDAFERARRAVDHCCVSYTPRIIVWHARSVSTHGHPVTFVAPRPYHRSIRRLDRSMEKKYTRYFCRSRYNPSFSVRKNQHGET